MDSVCLMFSSLLDIDLLNDLAHPEGVSVLGDGGVEGHLAFVVGWCHPLELHAINGAITRNLLVS